ncbi:uncharacterized protein LOC133730328 [Rosa rugosa]|uniref:uncharacterized protein LOC133730328 n=1 Tax=Rosa rugosa TaxID=74645 RepID=UPI002B4130D6|nr:uncharacterized protein LOC133730328 [Rosa rugosa]
MFIKTIADCLENPVDDLFHGGENLVGYPNIENGGVECTVYFDPVQSGSTVTLRLNVKFLEVATSCVACAYPKVDNQESPRIRCRPSYTEPPKLTGLWKQGLQQRSIPFARFSLVSPSLRSLQPRLSISRSRFILLELLVQESATSAVEIAGKHFPGVECKWGDQGLEEIIADSSILGVAVVLAGQAQV